MEKQNINKSSTLNRIQQYISRSDNPLPTLTNDHDIEAQLRFYFNDQDILLYYQQNQNQISIFKIQQFNTKINSIYNEWKQAQTQPNFLNFVQFWVEKDEQLQVHYEGRISESVIDIQVDETMRIKNNILQSSSNIEKLKLKNDAKIEKRLHKLFSHFSKTQKGTRKEGTFEQLNVIYETMNLTEWIAFIKAFQLYEGKRKQISSKQRNKFKIIFDHFANNQKRLSYRDFQEALKAAFYAKFRGKDGDLLRLGYNFMGIESQSQFQSKIQELALNIPKQIYCSQRSMVPNYREVNSRYLLKGSSGEITPVSNTEVTTVKRLAQVKVKSKQKKVKLNLQVLNEPDEFLDLYHKKQHHSLGVIRRIDDRIEKFLSKN